MGNTFLCIACREGYLELADYLISEAMSLGMAHLPPFVPMTVVVKRYDHTNTLAGRWSAGGGMAWLTGSAATHNTGRT